MADNIAQNTTAPQKSAFKYSFSIIIPVLNEAELINDCLGHFRNQIVENSCQIIVADADPDFSTAKAIKFNDVLTVRSERGRARQMNTAADLAEGEILLFLHADTKLPPDALKKIRQVLENPKYVGGAFDLGIDSEKFFLKFIANRASFRSRLTRMPYGDQAIFIRKSYFDKIGRFKDITIMEDVELMRRIKKLGGQIYIIDEKVLTSPRRWEKEGAVYTTLRNQILIVLYYLGVSPNKLARFYGSSYVKTEK